MPDSSYKRTLEWTPTHPLVYQILSVLSAEPVGSQEILGRLEKRYHTTKFVDDRLRVELPSLCKLGFLERQKQKGFNRCFFYALTARGETLLEAEYDRLRSAVDGLNWKALEAA